MQNTEVCICVLWYVYAICAGAEVLDAAKEKDGILSLQLLESKVDHSVRSDYVSCNECLKFILFTVVLSLFKIALIV